jgi:hypothetical protein
MVGQFPLRPIRAAGGRRQRRFKRDDPPPSPQQPRLRGGDGEQNPAYGLLSPLFLNLSTTVILANRNSLLTFDGSPERMLMH